MRLASYLSTSRHGIYYFRFPMPADLHPGSKPSQVKISLGTRDPKEAGLLARLLSASGQCTIRTPFIRTMRYDEMREHVRDHFAQLLISFREKAADDGPPDQLHMDAMKASQALVEAGPDGYVDLTSPADKESLLRRFCAARDVPIPADGRKRKMLSEEFFKGYREYLSRALDHTSNFDTLRLEEASANDTRRTQSSSEMHARDVTAVPFHEVASRYFEEAKRTKPFAPKTEADKRDALALLVELTGDIPPAHITKADAQNVKAALFKLPKNRTKNPKTRDLPLKEMLEATGVEYISGRTMNVYLGNMQSFFEWAVNNGYATQTVIKGLKLKNTKPKEDNARRAFSAEHLNLMYSYLTDKSKPVKKDVHKWPALVGIFTGMRLNEIAQLEIKDIELVDTHWFIHVTPDGDDRKRLKNGASRRRVPVHDRLIATGFIEFYLQQKLQGHTRLFHELSYSPQNGYGRNAGRWFNDKLLPELGLKGQGYVFHCLRHTMVTRLAQAGVEEPKVKALIGHSQTGVTLDTYFKDGFLPAQLRDAIHCFDF